MAVTITDIIVVMIAFTICLMIAALAKRHVRMHCQDNPEIVWIWLDDDEPQGGYRVKTDRSVWQTGFAMSPVPSI